MYWIFIVFVQVGEDCVESYQTSPFFQICQLYSVTFKVGRSTCLFSWIYNYKDVLTFEFMNELRANDENKVVACPSSIHLCS